ncbi:Beta-lactamase/transpeptidase-like protein [Pseudocohnilembus persalinus]|uniref:Beta-lactamase/transpeptidase-like protein n=1 Tax=Pseudocohnilembus persalinus TaxID=266149 RepID=A0A0V0QBB8_PSEPJ|nr:Beta-lactamase/transpeptidase-like protein [Pseudocohnilembus persalinus]|eukprot:KRW99496.1 Beta-lactamase/transpeptidase-like protein [Pseudocohnilembus persalinus]
MSDTQNASSGLNVPRIEELLVQGGNYYTKQSFLEQEPGKYFQYSDFNFVIIATIIENIVKQRFDIYMNENVLEPLGISGSFNIDDLSQNQINNLACLYDIDDLGVLYESKNCFKKQKPDFTHLTNGYIVGTNGGLFNPQGGLNLTLEELHQVLYMLYNDGISIKDKKQIIQKSSTDLMKTIQWQYDGNNAKQSSFIQAYGQGLQISTDKKKIDQIFPGRQVVGHTGQAYGLMSNMFFDAKNGNGYIFAHNGMKQQPLFSNKSKFYKIEQDLIDLSYNALYTEKYQMSFLVAFRIIIGMGAYIGAIIFGVFFCYNKKQEKQKQQKKNDVLLNEELEKQEIK